MGIACPSLVLWACVSTVPFSPVPVTLMGTGASFDLIDSVHEFCSWRCRPATLMTKPCQGSAEAGWPMLFSPYLYYLSCAGVQVWPERHGHTTHIPMHGISEFHQEGNSVCIHVTQPAGCILFYCITSGRQSHLVYLEQLSRTVF